MAKSQQAMTPNQVTILFGLAAVLVVGVSGWFIASRLGPECTARGSFVADSVVANRSLDELVDYDAINGQAVDEFPVPSNVVAADGACERIFLSFDRQESAINVVTTARSSGPVTPEFLEPHRHGYRGWRPVADGVEAVFFEGTPSPTVERFYNFVNDCLVTTVVTLENVDDPEEVDVQVWKLHLDELAAEVCTPTLAP